MTPDKLAQLEASLVDEHIAMLQEARRERDHHKQNASDYAEALSKEQAVNADLLAALEGAHQYVVAWRFEYTDKPKDAHNMLQLKRIDKAIRDIEAAVAQAKE